MIVVVVLVCQLCLAIVCQLCLAVALFARLTIYKECQLCLAKPRSDWMLRLQSDPGRRRKTTAFVTSHPRVPPGMAEMGEPVPCMTGVPPLMLMLRNAMHVLFARLTMYKLHMTWSPGVPGTPMTVMLRP